MKITVENNQVIVNLDEFEFPLFEAMAGTGLQRTCPTDFVGGTFLNKDYLNLWSESGEAGRASWLRPCRCEFRDFSWGNSEGFQKLLPMHLCRTIGEGRHAPTGDWPRRYATRQDFVYRSESAEGG